MARQTSATLEEPDNKSLTPAKTDRSDEYVHVSSTTSSDDYEIIPSVPDDSSDGDSHYFSFDDDDEAEGELVTKGDKNDKLVLVLGNRLPRAQQIFRARFVLQNQTILPPMSSVSHVQLWFQVDNFSMDPKLKFFLSGHDLSGPDKDKHPALLEIRAKEIAQLQCDPRICDHAIQVNARFLSKGGITVGLKRVRENNKDIEALCDYMLGIASSSNKGVNFQFRIEPTEWEKDLRDVLTSFSSLNTNTWLPYRDSFGNILTVELATRLNVQTRWEDDILKVPATNYFHDVEEAAVKLVYGSRLEYEVSLIHLRRLTDVRHKIFLLRVPESNIILAGVNFGKLEGIHPGELSPFGVVENPAPVPANTKCTVSITLDEFEKPIKLTAISVPDSVGLRTSCHLVLLVSPSKKHDARLSSIINEWKNDQNPEKEHPCTINFQANAKQVTTEVDAVNALCSKQLSRWHPVLLNQESTGLPNVDIFKGLSEEEIQKAYEGVYGMRTWNEKQLGIFRLLRHVPGNGFAFVNGIFGCGKTLVQATIAKLLVDLGKHVLIVAPTNAALQALSKSLVENAPDVDAVRVVFAGAKKVKRFGDPGDISKDEDEELAMFRLLQSSVTSRALRYDVEEKHCLQLHVENLVNKMSERKEKLLFEHRSGRDVTAYDAIDIYSQYKTTNFAHKLRKSQTPAEKGEWTERCRLFKSSLYALEKKVVADTKVLCTQQLAASTLVSNNFASQKSDEVIVIADEDGQALEPMAWIPIALPNFRERIKAVLRFGDPFQLPPLALSAATPLSEFGPQMNLSLFERHLRQHAPAATLDTQYRMHPELSRFPSEYTYKGRLIDGDSCSEIEVDPVFGSRVAEWMNTHAPAKQSTRLLGINVKNGVSGTERSTTSRSNKKNFEAVSEMLWIVYKEEPYPTATIVIITPYKAQRALYMKFIRDLHVSTRLPFSQLPRVATIDSIQGHESDIVILDWVRGYYGGLGFLKDNRRINVALTRARSNLIVVFNDSKKHSNYDHLNDYREPGEKQEIRDHWKYLRTNNLVIDV